MIIRRKHTSNYTIVPNSLATDTRISTDARWCLWYLLTKPDNWQLQAVDLQNAAGWGRDKSYKIINELIDAGYIKRTIIHNGRIEGVEYVVTDDLDVMRQVPENQDTENQHPENQHLNKNGKEIRTEHRPTRARHSRVPADFQPDETSRKRALEKGLREEDLNEAVQDFIDYWTGRGEARADWQATFRNGLDIMVDKLNRRLRNGKQVSQADRTQRGNQSGEPSTLAERMALIREAIAHGGA